MTTRFPLSPLVFDADHPHQKGNLVFTDLALAAKKRTKLLVTLVLSAVLLLPFSSPAHADLAGPTDGGRAIILSSKTREVADGIEQSTYERMDARGRNVINVLKVSLAKTDVKYLDSGKVAGVQTLTEMAKAGDVDAAVNGDFFDINNTGAVLGAGVELGEVIKSPNEDHREVATVSTDGLGAITQLILQGEATVKGGETIKLAGLNMTKVRPDRVAVYDHQWGDFTLQRPIDADKNAKIVRVRDGKVFSIDEAISPDKIDIPEGDKILLGRGNDGVAKLSALKVGDEVEVSVGISENVDDIALAIGGNWSDILKDGKALDPKGNQDAFVTGLHPRTAIGFGDGGKTMYLVTVDGRSKNSRGMDLGELGRLMRELGATEAMNLDGGGSTTMVARDPGDDDTSVENTPSDGTERNDGNGIGVVSKGSDGKLSGINVQFQGVSNHAERVFPGTKRQLTAKGHDRGGRPVDAKVTWKSSNPDVLTVDGKGVITAVKPGKADVVASSGNVAARTSVRVLGKLQRITVSPNVTQISGPGESKPVNVVGHDPQGYTAPIDPSDVKVSGADAMKLVPSESSTFLMSSEKKKVSGVATFTVLDTSAEMSYLVGRETVLLTDMSEDVSKFKVDGARSTQTIEKRPGEGRNGSDAMAFTVDFSQSSATRTANFKPNKDTHARRFIDGTAVELRVWLKGDGKFQPMMYTGVDNKALELPTVYAPRIQKTDEWQQAIIKLPQGFKGPFFWSNFAFYETGGDQKYKTTVLIDSVELVVAPNAEAPKFVQPRDPATIVEAGSTDDNPTRIAVMSDAQFVGRNPDSALVAGARRTLREMVAAKPDAIYIVGDFTDEANDEDFELAKKILDEEVKPSGIPWVYVPGNHEIMGQPIENFKKHFGDVQTLRTIGSTRIITLESGPYDLGHDFEQIKWFRKELDRAAADKNISGVVVMFHHPTRDFLPDGGSGLRDPKEAAMIEEWLSRFNETSGKKIALVGAGVGAFHARQQDNVLHITNGNSGKAATSSVDWGGFRGWTMLGINPGEGPKVTDWMEVETRAWVDKDSLAIKAPVKVTRNDTVEVDAGFKQDGIDIPVRWPVSAKWGGKDIYVGTDAKKAPKGSVAVFNPETRTIKFLDGAGDTVTLTLTVNGTTTSHAFTLAAQAAKCTVKVAAPGSVVLNKDVSLQGTAPGCERENVVVQMKDGEGWKDIGDTTVGNDGRFTAAIGDATNKVGTHQLRVVVGKDNTSNVVTVQRVKETSFDVAKVTAVGRAANAWGTVHDNARISTQVHIPGKGWSTSQTIDAKAGFWQIPLTYGRNSAGTLRWRVVVKHSDGSIEVTPEKTQRRVGVTAHTAGTKRVGALSNVWGTVDAGANAKVWTEVRVGGKWSRSQVRTAEANGFYAVPLTYGATTPGTYQWRVGAHIDGVGTVYSKEVTLTRSR